MLFFYISHFLPKFTAVQAPGFVTSQFPRWVEEAIFDVTLGVNGAETLLKNRKNRGEKNSKTWSAIMILYIKLILLFTFLPSFSSREE